MSYILNALRKSEQERQALKPDNLSNRVMINQPSKSGGSRKYIPILIITNISLILYFLFGNQLRFDQKIVNQSSQSGAEMPQKTLQQSESPSIAQALQTLAETERVKAEAEKLKMLAEAAKIEQTATKEKVQAVLPEETAVQTSNKTPLSMVDTEAEPILPPPIEKPTEPIKQNDLPYFNDLALEDKPLLPRLNINVLAYNPDVSKRFVIIDMIKYTVGQRIKDMLDLKEIREDCIVVAYNNHLFKLK